MISFKILGSVEEDSRECSRRFCGMLVNILGIAQEDSRGMFNTRFLGILKKIGCFIIQLSENRIKEYMLKHNQKYGQKLIKTSHMSTCKYYKTGTLKYIAKLTRKHLWLGFFLSKTEVLQFANLLKKRLRQCCFPVNFEKFLRRPFS